MKELNTTPNDWIWKYRYDILWCFVIFAIYLVVYFPMCVRHGVAVEETQFTHKHLLVQLCNGRWGVYLFRTITCAGEYLPYAAGILAGLFISAAVLIQTKILNITSLTHKFVYASFYLGCTQWAYQLRYSNQSHAIGLGIFCVSAAVYMQFKAKNKYAKFLGSAILLCIGLSTYQTLILYYFALVLAVFLCKLLQNKNNNLFIKDWRNTFSISIIAIALYYIILKSLIFFIQPPAGMLENVAIYQKSMSGYQSFLEAPFITKIKALGHFILTIPLKNILTLDKAQWIATTAIIPCLILFFHFANQKNRIKSILMLGIVLSILFLPYWNALLLLHELPARTLISIPLSISVLWGIAFTKIPILNQKRVLNALIGLACYILIFSMCRVATISRDEHWAWERSKEELLAMYSKAQQIAIQNGLNDCPIYILGEPSVSTDHLFDLSEVGFCPNSVFPNIIKGKEWSEYYFYYLRLPRLKFGEKTDVERHQNTFYSMSTYPADGSIKTSNGEVIIKIGELKNK